MLDGKLSREYGDRNLIYATTLFIIHNLICVICGYHRINNLDFRALQLPFGPVELQLHHQLQ